MPKPTFFNLPEDKRQRILDLAVEEFADNDYKNASLSNIVARAGIAKGSVYQYFEDKRDLYFYLLQLATQEKKNFLKDTHPPDPRMNVYQFLRWMMREGTRFELSRPKLAQVAYRALFSDRPFGDEPFSDIKKAAHDYYAGLVELGVAQGVIDPHIDRGLAVFVVSTLFNEFGRYLIDRETSPQALIDGTADYQSLPIEPLSDQLILFLERGLAPKC